MLPIPNAGVGHAALHAVELAEQRRAAAGGLVGLAAHDVRGCVRLFAPRYRHLSPARGALLVAAPCALANLHACASVLDGANWRRLVSASPTAQLASSLFHRHAPDEPPRATQLRSLPAAYLDARLIGHVAGLAARRATEHQIHDALRAHCSIAELARESGVTVARFVRLAELVRDACDEGDEYGMASALGAVPGAAVLLRLLWERAKTRSCLLDYVRALACHVPDALSAEGARSALGDDAARDEWVRAAPSAMFTPSAMRSDVPATAAAAPSALAAPTADATEALVAQLLARVTYKPLVQQGRYGFRGQPARPDCVEACARELIEVLLYDPATAALDAARLPPSADASLLRFVTTRQYAAADGGGQAWFDLCSARPGVSYLAGAGRDRYELAPSLPTLTAISAALLGLGGGCETVEELAARWNALSPCGPRLRGWATVSSFVVQEVAWFELLAPAAPRAMDVAPDRRGPGQTWPRTDVAPDSADDERAAPRGEAEVEDASVGSTLVIALRPNSNHAFARRPPIPLSAPLRALRDALLRAVDEQLPVGAASAPAACAEWSWALPALASGELLLPTRAPVPARALSADELDRATAGRLIWADLVHARARLVALRAAAGARGRRCEALAPWLLEPLAAERDARLSVAVARVLVDSGWARDAPAVRSSALREPLLALTLALLRRDWPLFVAAWAQARRGGEGLVGAAMLLGSAIGVAWMPTA